MARWKTHDLEKFFDNLKLFDVRSGMQDLASDVYEEGDAVVVKMNIPGIAAEKIDVTVEKNYVRVVAEQEAEEISEGRNYLLKEMRHGDVERLIDLHVEVDPDKATADYTHGVLTLVLPKARAAAGKKVKVDKK